MKPELIGLTCEAQFGREVPQYSEPKSVAHWQEEISPFAESSARHVFDSEPWLRAWERADAERVLSQRYLRHHGPVDRSAVTPFYLVADSPMWNSYETDACVEPVWSGPVVATPSLYSFYGSNSATIAQAKSIIELGIEQARQWGAAALVVGNLEPDAASTWSELIPPAIAIVLDKTYRADLSDGFESHLARMSRNARRSFNRGWRRSVRLGVSLSILQGDAMVPRLDEMAALAHQTSVHHGPSLYTPQTFRELSRVPGATLFVAEHEGEMVGAFLGFLHAKGLYMWACGYNYNRRAELGTYSFLLYESICFALRNGCRYMEVGRGNFSFKERHGFTPIELWSLIYLLPGPERSDLLRKLLLMQRGLRAFIPASPKGEIA